MHVTGMARMEPIRLWHTIGSRGFRCVWTLEELGMKGRYELVTMPFPPRVL